MLGAVSHLNVMLQDHHSKISFSIKKQILRALESLIVQVGPSVHGISLQVRVFAIFGSNLDFFLLDYGHSTNYVSGPRTC
jgi:hypothetical protein